MPTPTDPPEAAPDEANAPIQAPPPAEAPHSALVAHIAKVLGESNRFHLGRVVGSIGLVYAQAMLEETHAILADGGLPTLDGEHQRTPGGIFFHLVRESLSDEATKRTLFSPRYKRKKRRPPKTPTVSPLPALEAQWAKRLTIVPHLAAQRPLGEIHQMKVTLMGRPTDVAEQTDYTTLVLRGTDPSRLPDLAKGLPPVPPTNRVLYVLYISAKQWQKVKGSLAANEEDLLIVDGIQSYDPELKKMVIFVQGATTKLLQRGQHHTKRAQAKQAG